MTDTTNKPENQKDGLALVVGGLFILALVFAAYNYFSKGNNAGDAKIDDSDLNFVEKLQPEEKTEEANEGEPAGDLNGAGAADTKTETLTPTTSQPVTEVNNATWGMLADYAKGDIATGNYTVKSGDTLWEIADGAYGNGAEWTKILASNSNAVGVLGNGQQALIVPGQVIVVPQL